MSITGSSPLVAIDNGQTLLAEFPVTVMFSFIGQNSSGAQWSGLDPAWITVLIQTNGDFFSYGQVLSNSLSTKQSYVVTLNEGDQVKFSQQAGTSDGTTFVWAFDNFEICVSIVDQRAFPESEVDAYVPRNLRPSVLPPASSGVSIATAEVNEDDVITSCSS
jgi:hypothetical protein